MRGRLHQVAFICSIPAGVLLVALGRTGAARASTAIYAVSMMTLYGVSASYHRITWSPKARMRMRRLDHASIFVLIAGSYTPFTVLGLQGAWRVSILAVVWGVAAIGIALKVFHFQAMNRAGSILYIALGWTAVVTIPQLVRSMSAAGVALLALGGLLYTSGAIMFAMRKPSLRPSVFGYHEFWHSFVIAGSACHYVVVLLLVLDAR